MTSERKGITVAGSLIADVVYTTDTYPEEGFLANIRETNWNVGGSGNLILDLAKMNPSLQINVSAIIGEDEAGKMLWDTLGSYSNINTANVTRVGKSSVTHVIHPLDTKQRTFFFQGEASNCYDINSIDWAKISSELFVLEYLLLMEKVDAPDAEYGTHGARILCEAKKHGMKTAIDMVSEQGERARMVVCPALKYTDYCIINELEAEAITGISVTEENVGAVLCAIRDLGVSEWIVIHTSAGAYGMDCTQEEIVYVPSLKLPKDYIKGNTGAGDAFCAGILYGRYTKMPLKKAMRFAAAAAACSLSEQNGTDGLREEAKIWELETKYMNKD